MQTSKVLEVRDAIAHSQCCCNQGDVPQVHTIVASEPFESFVSRDNDRLVTVVPYDISQYTDLKVRYHFIRRRIFW